jgi:hypothetical protein
MDKTGYPAEIIDISSFKLSKDYDYYIIIGAKAKQLFSVYTVPAEKKLEIESIGSESEFTNQVKGFLEDHVAEINLNSKIESLGKLEINADFFKKALIAGDISGEFTIKTPKFGKLRIITENRASKIDSRISNFVDGQVLNLTKNELIALAVVKDLFGAADISIKIEDKIEEKEEVKPVEAEKNDI